MPRFRLKAATRPRRRCATSVWFLSTVLCLSLLDGCWSPPPSESQVKKPEAPSAPEPAREQAPQEIRREDLELQQASAEALGDREGAVLVIDPQTGRLRA